MKRICARETCGHDQDGHGDKPWPPGRCKQPDCGCVCFIFPLPEPRNPDFPGSNVTVVLGKHQPPTDLGCSQDQLLVACARTIMRLCEYINVTPDARLKTAVKAIEAALDEISESCQSCQLAWSQAYGDRGQSGHLYGCEVAKKRQAQANALLDSES